MSKNAWLDFRRLRIGGLLDCTLITATAGLAFESTIIEGDAWFDGAELAANLKQRPNPDAEDSLHDDERLKTVQGTWDTAEEKAASVWLPFLPMLAIHLLIQKMLYDISQVGIPFDRMDPEYLEKPRKWQVNDLGRFMLCIGPISSIFDITTFCVMYFVFAANSSETQSLFQSGWFIEGLLSQTLIIHMISTAKVPFFQSTAASPLLVLTLCVMAIGIAVPYSPLGAAVGLVPLPLAYFPWLAVTLLCYCLLTQVVKRWYIRKFGTWL